MISLRVSLFICLACSMAYEFKPMQDSTPCFCSDSCCQYDPCCKLPDAPKVVLDTIKWPIQIAVSHKTENLYIVTIENNFVVLKRGETEVENIFMRELVNSVAIDNLEEKVYIGCSNGLKIYNEEARNVDDVPGWNQDTWQIFIPSGSSRAYAVFVRQFNLIFYESVTSNGVDQHFKIAREAGRQFVADNKGNYFFNSKESKVTQVLKNDMSVPIKFNESVNHFATNNNGCVYGIRDDNVYVLDLQRYDATTKLIMQLDFHPVSMCFDKNNNLILGTDKIVKIKNELFNNTCIY